MAITGATPKRRVGSTKNAKTDSKQNSPTSAVSNRQNTFPLLRHVKRSIRILQRKSLLRLLVLLLTFFSAVLSVLSLTRHHRSSVLYASSVRRRTREVVVSWKNRYNVVHVIQTRFMQFQPHLIELGRARLKLFQTITLPSVVQQTTANELLWIIRTDPNLDTELRDTLFNMVQEYDNIILVGSNDNPEGFKCSDCIADMFHNSTFEPIWSGSIETVLSYWEAAQIYPLLETRLDADDALLLDYCEILQADAAQNLQTSKQPSWKVWCPQNHVEWQYTSPWTSRDDNSNTTGAVFGSLIGLRTGHCVTAGLTW